MATYLQRERRRRIAVWIAVVLTTCAALAFSYWLVGPPPPKKIRLATGDPDGAYASFGQMYADILRKNGLQVELVSSSGSIDNFRRLSNGKVDAAFVQSGTYDRANDPYLVVRGIAAVYLEPLWVIYRGEEEVTDLSQFRGRSISIGPVASGTDAIARLLLEVNGITEENSQLSNLPISDSAGELEDGTIDVVFTVSSFNGAVVKRLLTNQQIRLMSFRRHEAYARIFPYLTPVELAEGVLDLKRDIPAVKTAVLAPSAVLACRRDLHPRVVEQLLTAARKVHSAGSILDKPGQFPSLNSLDLPAHETAEAYLRSGESLISRFVPYWAMHWLVRGQLFIIPVLTLWIPFFKILPLLYQLRIGTLLKKHYAALRDVESGIERAGSPDELNQAIRALETLRDDMERLSRKIPAYYQRDVYHWRAHVSMVQGEAGERLKDKNDAEPDQTSTQ